MPFVSKCAKQQPNRPRPLTLGIAAIALLSFAPASAQQECKIIADKDQRLACFDRTVVAASPQPAPPSRQKLIGSLDHWFLEAGVNVSVFEKTKYDASEKHFPGNDKPLPALTFFGFLDRATIYQIVTKSNLVRQAREAGFKTIAFYDKGPNGTWFFDLAGAGKTCAKDLCFDGT